tara:strand:+ start:397 stop:609 length:213 start_codon:yes stop_codon:yes gene_type:complete
MINIVILKSKEVEDPMSSRRLIAEAHLAATKEVWGYTIIKDRFNHFHENVDMTHQEFWSYVKTLESRRVV